MTRNSPIPISRRQMLRQSLGAGLSLPFASSLFAQSSDQTAPSQNLPAGQYVLTPEDDQFLQDVENACFQFFWEQQNTKTGLVQDRADVRGGTPGLVASIAATGFGLTALCIGEMRGFITRS